MTKRFLIVFIVSFIFQGVTPTSSISAADGAELFVKLTCFTCHGQQGKGMFRTKTKARYKLKKKVFAKLAAAGLPSNIIKKLKPLKGKKFSKEKKFLAALESVLGKELTNRYSALIVKIAGRIFYRKGDPVVGFEAYPKLAGNKEIYLYTQIRDILSGRRKNGNTAAMRGIKSFLDSNKAGDEEFRAIARYLSRIR